MMFMTMPWLTIQLTNSATMAGLVIAVTAIPGLILSPVMGSLIDRIGRRKVAYAAEGITVFTTVAYPIVALVTPLTVPLLLVIGVVKALFGGGGMTARKSLLPDVARESKMSLDRANSIHESLAAAAFATGPAIASVLIATFGAMSSFWVSAAAVGLSAIAAYSIKVHEHVEDDADEREGQSFISYAMQGFKILRKLPAVAIIFVMVISLALLYMPSELVLMPKYYASIHDPQTLGLLISVMAFCTSVGSLLFEKFTHFLSYANILRVTALGVAIGMLPMSQLPPTWIMIICGVVLGFVWGPMPPLLNTVIQRKVPPSMRGRVFSIEMTIWNAAPMISMVFAGAAADAYGVKPVYTVIALLVTAAAIAVSFAPALKDLNQVED